VSSQREAVILAVLQDAVLGVQSLEGTIDRIMSRNAVFFHGPLFHMEEQEASLEGVCDVLWSEGSASLPGLGRLLGGSFSWGPAKQPAPQPGQCCCCIVVSQWEVVG